MENIYERIRKQYGLSRSGMSRVLGFGVNQWRKYEEGEIVPKDSHALMISMIQDPRSFRKLLRSHELVLKRDIGDKRFVRVLGMVDRLLGEFAKKEDASYKEWVESLYK